MTSISSRSEHPISDIFLHRWSPRAFTGEEIPMATLSTFLEAARWAPSSYNFQPWHFIYARRGTPHWDRLLGLLVEFNRGWAQNASALIVVVSKKTSKAPGQAEEAPNLTHSFDAGAAWGYLALQASLSGWHTHGMGGLDRDRARVELGVPDNYAVEAAVAIGRMGDKASLSESLRARELPSDRKPLSEIATEGNFSGK